MFTLNVFTDNARFVGGTAENPYVPEDGVVVEAAASEKRDTDRRYRATSIPVEPTPYERHLEEIQWAQRSGPVVIKQAARGCTV